MNQTVEARATIAAAPHTVFECLADYRCAKVFIEGLEQLTPLGPQTTGENARFDATLKIAGRTLATVIVITSLEPGRSITWSSAGEDHQSLTFELVPEPGGTAVSLTVSYEQPDGLPGALLAPFVERTVRQRANGALGRLREHLLAE
ncbi:MAG: SRPBCC family protein [Acidimicrobiales bacterium]